MALRAAKYRRISDDREGAELGVGRQDQDLDALADRLGVTVVADYMDNDIGASTRSKKPRPQYQAMLDDARAGQFEMILAATSSRLTRRPRENEDLIDLAEQHGIRFAYAKSPSFDLNTADGRMIARYLAAGDAAESERIGERVAREAQQRAERGLPPRGNALGYTPDGRHLHPAEAPAVRAAYELLLAGGTLGAVAARWNAAGLTTCHGNAWSQKSVRDVLRNPRNAAIPMSPVPRRGGLGVPLLDVEAKWPAIVDVDVWNGVLAILNDPGRRANSTTARKYLLSGVALCGLCGGGLVSGGTRRGFRSLKCTGNRHLERIAEPIEEYVMDVAQARLRRGDAAVLLRAQAPDLGPLRARAAGLRAQRKALAVDTTVEHSAFAARDRALHADLTAVEAQLAEAVRGSALAKFAAAGANTGALWAGLDGVDERRAVVAELMDVVVLAPGRGARVFRDTSVLLVPRGYGAR